MFPFSFEMFPLAEMRGLQYQAILTTFTFKWKLKKPLLSSREPGIERSRSFLCLFFIFTAQKMPILSVKRIIEMPLQLMTSQALFQTFGPCSPGPLVFPRTSLCFPAPQFPLPVALSVCFEVLS